MSGIGLNYMDLSLEHGYGGNFAQITIMPFKISVTACFIHSCEIGSLIKSLQIILATI